MELLHKRLSSVLNAISFACRTISSIGILVGTGMVFVFTILRYFFDFGVGWSEEVIRIIMLFGAFALNGAVTTSGGMVRLSIVVDAIHDKVILKLMDIFNMVVCLIVGVIMSHWATQVFISAAGQTTASSYLPKQLQYLALPTGMYLLVVSVVIKLVLLCIELSWAKNGKTEEKEAD